MKNICVLGGGTAGWITALMVKKYYPNCQINLIESESVGILGAGEGTTPHFVDLTDFLEIPISEIFKHCDASVKHGVVFQNWHTENQEYIHDFDHKSQYGAIGKDLWLFELFSKGRLNDLSLSLYSSNKNKVTFYYKNNHDCLFDNPINSLNSFQAFAIHFNARLLADYLKQVGLSRGINLIVGEYENVSYNEQLNFKSIRLKDSREISFDFIFDCSGFARLITGNHVENKWISYKESLPLSKAVAFFKPHNNNTRPVTEAIALKNGWCWKIPVKDRYGCGYVYDENHASESQILEEIESKFGKDIQLGKVFNFEAGTYEKTILKNSMAVGLSQGFFEPLEATNIWAFYMNLTEFLDSDGINLNVDCKAIEVLNKRFLDRNDSIADFLYLHYYGSNRTDSNFWKNFKRNTEIKDSFKEKLECLQSGLFLPGGTNDHFSTYSWIEVAGNQKMLPRSVLDKKFSLLNHDQIRYYLNSVYQNYQNLSNLFISHSEFIKLMTNNH
jgi:tryptophan halogenase